MIAIDTTTKELVLTSGATIPRGHRFPLVHGHACPCCGLVLTAGFITEARVDVLLYGDTPAGAEGRTRSRYDVAFVGNAQLILRNAVARDDIRTHAQDGAGGTRCQYLAYTLDDLAENVRTLLFEEAHVNVAAKDVDLCHVSRDIPGLLLVPDVCGRIGPVLLLDPDELAGGCWNFKRETWEAYWARRCAAVRGLLARVAPRTVGAAT